MDDQCETCGGEGALVGDAVDRRGERVDAVESCPDCRDDVFDDEHECLGHPAGPLDPMGVTVYCDGTCRPSRAVR